MAVERPSIEPRSRESFARPITELIDAASCGHAGRDAIRSGETILTYRELAELIDRVAQAVVEAGVRPQDRVMLLFDHGPAAVIALLGVIKSGAIAVPLTTSTPVERRERISRDVQPACVVTDAATELEAQALEPQTLPVVTVDRLPPAAACTWPILHVTDPALIMYTSGSTGQPKGVVQTHASVLHKVWATSTILNMTPVDRVAMFSSYAVGQGLTTILSPLVNGAALCQFHVRRDGLERLAKWLADERITIYVSSATLFRHLVRAADNRIHCPDLRLVRLGSERVSVEDVEVCRRLFGADTQVLIAYSSTETANITMHLVGRDEEFPGGIVPVGRPSEGVSIEIVDDNGNVLPSGQQGEIVVRSAYLPLGYWRDVERTARVYGSESHVLAERRCRTGDVGRLRPDGCLEIVGRNDRRVKVRGFRIELDEIENLLIRHPAVSRAAVVATPDSRGDNFLVAYLELRPTSLDSPEGSLARDTPLDSPESSLARDTPLDSPEGSLARDTQAGPIEDIRQFALLHLPDHMVPSTFIVVDAMPVGETNKIDRSRLPVPPHDRPSMDTAYVPPRTTLERTVTQLWQDVLGLDAIGVHDPFLLVGGDSLRAAQIASRLSAVLDAEVFLWELLEASTIAGLASLITQKQQTADGSRRSDT
jgi:amino acid adenylation domain-containing protein